MISLAMISMYTRGSGSVESRIMSDLLGRAGTARDRIEREQRGGRSGGRRGLERTGAVKNCARVGLYLDGCALYHLRGGVRPKCAVASGLLRCLAPYRCKTDPRSPNGG